jgi:hypothetical protein
MSVAADRDTGPGTAAKRRLFRRGPWENLASVVIAAGDRKSVV